MHINRLQACAGALTSGSPQCFNHPAPCKALTPVTAAPIQVALIVVLAHIGCYVPASFASLRCVDRLLTRMGSGDSLEAGSFMLEMQARLIWLFIACVRRGLTRGPFCVGLICVPAR